MTVGEALEAVGMVGLFVGVFLVFGVGWALIVCAVLLIAAGELLDRRTNDQS